MHWAPATKNTNVLCDVLVTGTKGHLSFGGENKGRSTRLSVPNLK